MAVLSSRSLPSFSPLTNTTNGFISFSWRFASNMLLYKKSFEPMLLPDSKQNRQPIELYLVVDLG